MSYTKGPWHVWAGAIYQGRENDDLSGQLLILPLESGALLKDIKDGEWDDHVNAKPEDLRLAAAAPELLEALRMSVAAFEGDAIDEIEADYGLATAQLVNTARAAIQKATGEQP